MLEPDYKKTRSFLRKALRSSPKIYYKQTKHGKLYEYYLKHKGLIYHVDAMFRLLFYHPVIFKSPREIKTLISAYIFNTSFEIQCIKIQTLDDLLSDNSSHKLTSELVKTKD